MIQIIIPACLIMLFFSLSLSLKTLFGKETPADPEKCFEERQTTNCSMCALHGSCNRELSR